MSDQHPSSESANDKMTLNEILRTLTPKQFWALAGAIVVVLVGSTALGAWLQSARDDDKLMEKNRTIVELESTKDKAERERDEAKHNFDGSADLLREAAKRERALRGKGEFLERWLTYTNAPGEPSRKLFVDHVCALWKNSVDQSVRVESDVPRLTDAQIRGGFISEGLRKLLIDKGVSADFFAQAQASAPQAFPIVNPQVARNAANAIATIQKYAQSISLVKVIHFYDGTNYQVPDEIAAAVHLRPDCGPGK